MKIKALGYIVIEATDVNAWHTFFTEVVGLMPAPMLAQEDHSRFYKMDEYCWRVQVVKSDTDRLATAGWEVLDQCQFDLALERLEQQGISFSELPASECQAKKIRQGIRLTDPSGQQVEIFHAMQLDYIALNTPANVPAFETGFNGDMGLGHYVLPTDKFSECYDFYVNVLGFGDTDYMHFHFNEDPADKGQGLHFLHVDNPRHHSLAIYQEPNPPSHGCVHLMFEVLDADQVGLFIDRCAENNVAIVSTLGRHTNDKMMSVYVQSPGGFAVEFGCEGLQLDWQDYKPTESARPSIWGHSWQAPK